MSDKKLPDSLRTVKEQVGKLKLFLNDPHPGRISWNVELNDQFVAMIGSYQHYTEDSAERLLP